MDIYQACKDGNLDWIKANIHTVDLNLEDTLDYQKMTSIDIHYVASNCYTPIEYAITQNQLEIAKWIVMESGQPIDFTANNNWSVIRASKYGHLDVVKWLVLESGQPVDVTTDDSYAVKWAADYGHLDVIKWLVNESGQPVDVTTTDNEAVRWAAKNGHLEVVKWLVLESGQPVDVTAEDNEAVREAAINGHLDVVKWLVLESGQPVNVLDWNGYDINDVAGNWHFDVVDFLNVIEEIHYADITIDQIQARPKIVELAEKGMDPSVLIELSDTEIDELLANKATEKKKRTKLRVY